MRKHPLSLKLEGHLKEKNMQVKDNPVTLFEGKFIKVYRAILSLDIIRYIFIIGVWHNSILLMCDSVPNILIMINY